MMLEIQVLVWDKYKNVAGVKPIQYAPRTVSWFIKEQVEQLEH